MNCQKCDELSDRLIDQQAIQIVEQRILIRELRERLARYEHKMVREVA